MKKLILIIICTLATISSAFSMEKVKLFLKWDHQFQFAGYYAAIQKGFYKDKGIDVEIVSRIDENGNIRDLYQPLIKGEVDFSVGGPAVLFHIDKGDKLSVVSTFFQNSPFGYFSLKEKKIKGPADLVGKKLMISNGDFSEFEIKSMFHQEGIKSPKTSLVPWSFDSKAIYEGKVDVKGTYILSALWETRNNKKQLSYFTSSDFGLNFYGDLLLTRTEKIRSNPELVEAFREASVKGWVYALENPEEISRLIVDLYPAKLENYDDNYAFNLFSSKIIKKLMNYPKVEVGNTSPTRWRKIHEDLKAIDVLKNQFDEEKIIFNYSRLKAESSEKILNIFKTLTFLAIFVALVLSIYLLKTRSQKEIQTAKQKLSLVFDNSPIGIAFCDMDGVLLEVNKEYCRLTGYSFEELKELSYWDLTPEKYADQEEEQLKSLGEKGAYGPYRKEYKTKDQKLIPVELNGFIVEDYDGIKGIWSLVEDLTKKVEMENEIEGQRAIALHSSKLATIGEMASGVGHEVNNPLAICVGNLDLMNTELEKENPDMEKVFEKIKKIDYGHQRIKKIVEGLNSFTRSDSGNMKPISLNQAILRTIDLVREVYKSDGISIELDVPENKIVVKGHLGRIQQVIMNLLSNAKDSVMESEKKQITISLEKINEDQVVLSVKDSGAGIPDDIKEKLLNPFFTTKKIGKGTGLGLSIVNQIVTDMGADLKIESSVGEGAKFSIYFPSPEAS